jgi:hypothetical protein
LGRAGDEIAKICAPYENLWITRPGLQRAVYDGAFQSIALPG